MLSVLPSTRYALPFGHRCSPLTFVWALAVAWCLSITVTVHADELPTGFTPLFNGKDLTGWKVHNGKLEAWGVEDGLLVTLKNGGGWLMTEKEYDNFELVLQFRLSKMANSGIALRAPLMGDPAYTGMEVQILDDPNWKGLRPSQHTGSIYDVVAAAKQANKATGEWNTMRIRVEGRKVVVQVNGEQLVNANLDDYLDQTQRHPGLLRKSGHIGLQSHGGRIEFRNIAVRSLQP